MGVFTLVTGIVSWHARPRSWRWGGFALITAQRYVAAAPLHHGAARGPDFITNIPGPEQITRRASSRWLHVHRKTSTAFLV
jgi:hypothetical protein